MSVTTSPIASDGTFQLDGLRPGKVQIDIAGFTSSDSRGITISRIVHERASPGRRIELAPGQSISGVRVYLAYGTGVIKGQIKVEGGTLPADALILVSVQRPTDMTRVSSAQVDSRGRFVAQSIPTGTYEVCFRSYRFGPTNNLPRGFPRTQKQTVTVLTIPNQKFCHARPDTQGRSLMRLKSIQAISVLAITLLISLAALAQEPAAQTKDNVISGRVVSESGQPLSGVSVSLSAFGSSGGHRTTTDNEGLFKVQGLDAGMYRVF